MTPASLPSVTASLAARGYTVDARSQVVVRRPTSARTWLRQPVADGLLVLSALGVIVLSWVAVLAVLATSALVLVPSASAALADIAGEGAVLAVCLTLVGAAPYAVRRRGQRHRSTQPGRQASRPAGRQ